MPRIGRLVPKDAALHITCRGNNKQKIFNNDDDKLRYYSLIRDLKEENKITIFHYCLMDNHIHLIVWLSQQSRLARFMKQLNLSYFNCFKKIYGYSGHLWQGRFNSNLVDTDSYLLRCGKYIELNPVMAKIVNLPEEYIFSSYNHYAKGKPDSIITDSPAYLGLAESEDGRRRCYIDFVVDSSIINNSIFEKRLFIGSETFVRKLEEYYRIKNTRLERGRPRKTRK